MEMFIGKNEIYIFNKNKICAIFKLRIKHMRKNLPKKLILIRHAESDRNKALLGEKFIKDPKLMNAIGNIPDHKVGITENGKRQAIETSKKIFNKYGNPDIVFHSGYKRTKETAKFIFENCDKKVETVEDLSIRERENGYTHILLEEEKNSHFPYLQKYWDIVGGLFSRPVGGESLVDVIENRINPFLIKIFEEHQNKNIFLVTHGRVIQCMRIILDEMDLETMEEFIKDEKNTLLNCSVTCYELSEKENKLKMVGWNEVFYS